MQRPKKKERRKKGQKERRKKGQKERRKIERHAFIIDTPPYSVNIDTAPGEMGNATFTADQEGVFQYYCMYHPQTMRGQLVVLPQSSAGASSPAT